jgi:L-asparaginase / beta-aspartyl-peptidase
MDWTIVIHGGAGSMTRETLSAEADAAARKALKATLDAGAAILANGGSALDAVEAAAVVLEDDPAFNSGRGAVLTFEGGISLDAAIMDGSNRDAGAIAGTSIARNPVRAARRVMEASPHVLLSGEGADRFVIEQHLPHEGQPWFETPERRRQWVELRSKSDGWYDVDLKYGTVGVVARDAAGHVAAATSTGGLTGKRWGRIGDTPLIGSGTYADDRACAVSATGAGEFFIRDAVAHEITARVRLLGEDPATASTFALTSVAALGGVGGVIFVTPGGDAGWRFTTPGMYRGLRTSSGENHVAIYGDE